MTQNDISYYNARNEKRDMKLRRKETKRHNLAQERAQNLSAQASYMGAQASQTSAAAAQQQAGIQQKKYELDWESAYGMPYGNDPTDLNNYITVTDVITGDTYQTTKFPEPMTYSEKKANVIEKQYKAKYEKAGAEKQKMETAYGTVRIVREGIGTVNDTLNLGSKMVTMYNKYAKPSEALSSATGTDLIVFTE